MEPNWDLAGELLLAVSGLWPTEPLTRREAAAAEALPKQWQEEIRTLLSGGAATKPKRARKVRFLAMWKRLNDDEGFDRLTSQIREPKIAAAYSAARTRVLQFLRERLKPVMVEDLQGTRLLDPSVGQQLRANALAAAAGDPGRFVYGLRAGVVSPDLLDLVQEGYPSIEEMLRQVVDAELHRQRSQRAGYRVPWPAEVVLRAFLGTPPGAAAPPAGSPAQPGDEGPDADSGGGPPAVPNIDIKRDRQDFETKTDRVTELAP